MHCKLAKPNIQSLCLSSLNSLSPPPPPPPPPLSLLVVRVGFERSEYQIFESVGRDMGLLVCVTVEDVIFPFTLTTTTMDISATGTASS